MRDGIHKGAPVPPIWRVFVKHSAREADWQRADPCIAKRAVASLAKEIRSQFLKEIEEELSNPQLTLKGRRAELEDMRLRGPLRTLEARVIDLLLDEHVEESSTADSLCRSLELALAERSEAMLRAIEIYVESKFPRDRPELMRRMHSLLSKVDMAEVADEKMRGEVEEAGREKSFDWEQDLSGGDNAKR
jgi:hypothetical protein